MDNQNAQLSGQVSVNKDVVKEPSSSFISTVPKWVIIPLIFLVPPVAWFLMAKQKKYHSWIVFLTLLHGFIPILIGIYMQIINSPIFMSSYDDLGVGQSPEEFTYVGIIMSLIFSVILISLGMILRSMKNNRGYLTNWQIVFAYIIVLSSYILGFLSAFFAMSSIVFTDTDSSYLFTMIVIGD